MAGQTRPYNGRPVFPSARHFRFGPFPPLLREAAASLLAVIFPTPCSLCQEELTEPGLIDICARCWAELEPWTGPACARCGLPFASAFAGDFLSPYCTQCRAEEFQFDAARSYGAYFGKLRLAILQLKFLRKERLGTRLGALMERAWDALSARMTISPIIIPVPLHSARKRERGFNQAEALARGLRTAISKSKGTVKLKLETRVVKRNRATAAQSGLSLAQRHENVRGVFTVVRPEPVRGREVVLVDDVMTTGATMSACAAALKKAGAAHVLGLTLARATPQFPDPDFIEGMEAAHTIDEIRREWR